jgi:hypothetical protein
VKADTPGPIGKPKYSHASMKIVQPTINAAEYGNINDSSVPSELSFLYRCIATRINGI